MVQFATFNADVSATHATNQATSGTTAKGAWAEVAASIGFTAKAMWICHTPVDAPSDHVLDLGIGASGSEVVLYPDVLADAVSRKGHCSYVECDIPSGTRIAARVESTGTANVVDVFVIISDTRLPELATYTYTDYGTNPGGSSGKGTDVDPGGSANTKGAYAPLVTTADSDVELLMVIIGGNQNTAMADCYWFFDLAVGPAASEVNIVENIPVSGQASRDQFGSTVFVFPGEDFQSQRISLRSQCDITNATDRLRTCSLIAIRGVPSGAQTVNLAGAISAVAGALVMQPQRTFSGTASPSGSLALETARTLGGGVTPAASLNSLITTTFVGGLSPSGIATHIRMALQSLAGTLSPSGQADQKPSIILGGTLTSGGALAGQAKKLLTGTLTSSATSTHTRAVLKSVAGSISSGGALIKSTAKIFGGTVTSAGALLSQIQQVLSATLTTAGAVLSKVQKVFTGTLTSSSVLVNETAATLAVAGTLTSSGVLTQQVQTMLAASISSASALGKNVAVVLTGAITPTAALVAIRTVLLSLSAASSLAGALALEPRVSKAGSIASSSTLASSVSVALSGAVTSAGILANIREVTASLAGTLTSSGALVHRVEVSLAGTSSSAGVLAFQAGKLLAGTLTPAGAVTEQVARVFTGTLTLSGVATSILGGVPAFVTGTISAVPQVIASVKVVPQVIASSVSAIPQVIARALVNLKEAVLTVPLKIYIDNDVILELKGLTDQNDGSFLNNKTVTARVIDESDVEVVTPQAIAYVAASNGDYKGVVNESEFDSIDTKLNLTYDLEWKTSTEPNFKLYSKAVFKRRRKAGS